MHAVAVKANGPRRLRRTCGVLTAAVAATAVVLAATPAAFAGAAPAARFVGTGTTYWEYADNDGTGNLVVTFNTTEPGLAPNQADVTYAFDSGTQPFFANSGEIIVTGSWATGWDASTQTPASTVHIGPFGDGTAVAFQIEGFLVTQAAGFGQGPWEVDGTFTPTTGA